MDYSEPEKYYLLNRIVELEELVDKLSKYSNYLASEITDIHEIIREKKIIFKYLDSIDEKILEQYIRGRKLKKLNDTRGKR